jgi:coenzyme F420-reducing hydrogenase gamma subunit
VKTKPTVAFFDFACCEGCQLQIANLEEDIIGLLNLVNLVEFREVLTGKADKYDIAFIEGSITRKSDEEKIKDIRSRSGLIVSYGQCAVTGGINRLKNNWGNLDAVKQEVYGESANMPHLDTYPTKGVDEVVAVDLAIPGCPINRNEFLRIVKELSLGKMPRIPDYPVCVECKMKENICLYDCGKMCLGPVARAGCEAICPTNGVVCEACRGTVPNPNKHAMHEVLTKYNCTVEQVIQKMNLFGMNPEVKR